MYIDGKYQKNPRDIPIHPTKISGVLWSQIEVFQICLKSEASLFTPFHLFFVAFKKVKFPASSDGYPPARWQKKLISLKVAPGRSTAALLAITQVSHYFDPTFFGPFGPFWWHSCIFFLFWRSVRFRSYCCRSFWSLSSFHAIEFQYSIV